VPRGVHLEVEAFERRLVGCARLAVEREEEEAATRAQVVVLAVLVLRPVDVDQPVARGEARRRLVGTPGRARCGRLLRRARGRLAGRLLGERPADSEQEEPGGRSKERGVAPPHHGSRKKAWLFEPWIAVWQRVQSR